MSDSRTLCAYVRPIRAMTAARQRVASTRAVRSIDAIPPATSSPRPTSPKTEGTTMSRRPSSEAPRRGAAGGRTAATPIRRAATGQPESIRTP